MDKRALAQKIRDLRQAAGFTQEELADKAHVALRALQRLESANGNPTLDTILAISAILGFAPFADFKTEKVTLSSLAEYEAKIIEILETRLPEPIDLTLMYRELWKAWKACEKEHWRRSVALFFLTDEDRHLDDPSIPNELKKKLVGGVGFHKMRPSRSSNK